MISIIVAIGKNRAIGRNNQLLWHIPDDLKHFKKITTGHTIVMGDRTFNSIGKPLPNRKNIVVTRNSDFKAEGCEISYSLEEVLKRAKEAPEEIFIIGGGQIYNQALPWADKLYLTLVDDEPQNADTFFGDYSEFKNVVKKEENDNGKYKFTFLELTK
jgi:dihydrofolate reductase